MPPHLERPLTRRFATEKLRDGSTYRVAFVVGTLINVYGQFAVPYLRGNADIWGRFVSNLEDTPLLGAFSIALAYIFPVIVQVHAAVTSRVQTHEASLAESAAVEGETPGPNDL